MGVTGLSEPNASGTPASARSANGFMSAARTAPSRRAYIPARPPHAASNAGCALTVSPNSRIRASAADMNPLADLADAGVPLAFGSDSPVTPIDPWAGVLAAARHHEPGQRLSLEASFRAHTVGGRRAAN